MSRNVPEWWADEPLRRFVEGSSVDLAVVMRANGQVVAQQGFSREVDVMAVSALAAAVQASSEELGRSLDDGRPFADLYQSGESRRIFLGRCDTPRGPFHLLAVFGDSSSIGLVQLFFEEFRREILQTVEQTPPTVPLFEEDFDLALARSLDAVFAPRVQRQREE